MRAVPIFATDSNTQRKKTSLLDLPPEVWSKICKPLVTYDYPISIYTFYNRDEFGTVSINCWSYNGALAGKWSTLTVHYQKVLRDQAAVLQ